MARGLTPGRVVLALVALGGLWLGTTLLFEKSTPPHPAASSSPSKSVKNRPTSNSSTQAIEGRPVAPPGQWPGGLILPDPQNRVVVVHFFATWCAPCREEIPQFRAFASAHQQEEWLSLYAVAVADQEEALQKLVGTPLGFGLGKDPQWAMAHAFGTDKLPETYFIDRQSHLASRLIGVVPWENPKVWEMLLSLRHEKR